MEEITVEEPKIIYKITYFTPELKEDQYVTAPAASVGPSMPSVPPERNTTSPVHVP